MQKFLSFTVGVLLGTIAATAWAKYSNYPTVDSPPATASLINPSDMMARAPQLPVEQHDAF